MLLHCCGCLRPAGYHNKLANNCRPRARQNCPNFYNSFAKYVSLLFGTWGSSDILLYVRLIFILIRCNILLPRCFVGEFLWRPWQLAGLFGQMPPHNVETSMLHCEPSWWSLLRCGWWWWEDFGDSDDNTRKSWVILSIIWQCTFTLLFRKSQFCSKNYRDCFRERLTERNVSKTKSRGKVLNWICLPDTCSLLKLTPFHWTGSTPTKREGC